MKLILTREVSGLGGAGDVVTVKDGYGRNFLLARGSAIMWTKGGEGQIEGINIVQWRVRVKHSYPMSRL